jgi:putative spermidine/putrescine transport system permease protein
MRAKILLLSPLMIFLVITYLLPFLGVVKLSVTDPTLGFSNYNSVVTDDLLINVVIRTFRICVLVTVLSVIAAYAVTFLWVRSSRTTRLLVEICIMIPFWISVLSRAFGWIGLLSNRGILNSALKGIGLDSLPFSMINSEIGVIIGMTHFLIPFAVFPLASSMRAIDERVLTAAVGMGASQRRIFWQIFVPMTKSGIIGGALLVFVFSMGFYIMPALLGGGKSVMIAELIYLRIFQIPQWGLAAAMSVMLLAFVGGFLVMLIRRNGGEFK